MSLCRTVSETPVTSAFWATVTSNGSRYTGPLFCMPVCPVCTSVYCGQTVGWIKMPLSTEVGLGAGEIVLHGDPAPPRKWAQQPPLFGPYLLWPNGNPSQQLLNSCRGILSCLYKLAMINLHAKFEVF